ncbi:MAG: hypothetical protein PVF15_09265 [Candidatus Bathyarchaeota archaeon]
MTKQGPFRKELLAKDSRVSLEVVDETLDKLCQERLCQQKQGVIEAASFQRLGVAVRAIRLGADLERVCTFLQWREFENLAAETFKVNSYNVTSNFRFKHAEKRWEVDLVACKEPLVVCADCKHWHHGWTRAAIVKAVEMQMKRTKALADAFPTVYSKIKLQTWKQASFIPTVLSLTQGPFKFHNEVPIVPILKMQSFLNDLPAYASSLTHFSIKVKSKRHNLTE